MDLANIYSGSHRRTAELVRDLPTRELFRTVPGCPQWRLQDLIAHLSGLAYDVQTGNVEGAGTDPWAARQVAERIDRTLPELLAEWDESEPSVQAIADAAPRAVIDCVVHEHDVRGALGIPGPSDGEAVGYVLGAVLEILGPRLDAAGVGSLALRVDGGPERVHGTASPGAALEIDSHELFRSLFGRRSADQVRAYTWIGDPEPYLGMWSFFGPLPETDVLEGPQYADAR
ncbi:MAG: hypothetical protein JWL73_796 [Actinomycetia bacterium]|nr:hypothetical protein [Actinomycetes bacterium]